MGSILFGYEGNDMPVLFTKKGLIHLQRKVENISKKEEERLEKEVLSEEEIERKKNVTDRNITMEWVGANTNVEIIKEEKTYDYHTYGLLTEKAYGYKKITYKNLYNGIDLVYSFTNNKIGFEYALIVKAGADVGVIKMKYGGDVKSIKINGKGNLLVKSDINGIEETLPVTYYNNVSNNKETVKVNYLIKKRVVEFFFQERYDTTREIIIDPFISSTSNLSGLFAGKAKDIDYDYEGNIYVAGGGDFANCKLAKYNSSGVLQWTFNGNLPTINWLFGFYYGGWVVEKITGSIYLGNGTIGQGVRVVRITTAGLYDNFVTIANINFTESWKIYWSCNNGNPQI